MLRTFLSAALLILAFAGCKKDEGSSGEGFEALGTFGPESTIGFAVSGEPMIFRGGAVYRFDGNWRQVGGPVGGNIQAIVNDARGDYFAHDGRQVLRNVGGSAAWDTVSIVSGRTNLGNTVVMNAKGDLVARVSVRPDTFAYYRKGGTESDWTFVTSVPALTGNEARHFPAYLSNEGILYYNFDVQSGFLTDLIMNTRTGAYGLLYDKARTGSTGIGGNGILPGNSYVSPDGDVWGVSDRMQIYTIDGGSLPGRVMPQPEYTNPKLHDGDWQTRIGPIAVDASGRLRCLLICDKYPDMHWSPATASSGGGSFKVVTHGLGQRQLRTNFKGEVFVWENNGLLYRWR